jgi:hypothetical protein
LGLGFIWATFESNVHHLAISYLNESLGRDKDGNFLAKLMSEASANSQRRAYLFAAIRTHTTLEARVVALLPKVVDQFQIDFARSLPTLLFADITSIDGNQQRLQSIQILNFAAALMAARSSVNVDAILSELDRVCYDHERADATQKGSANHCLIRYLGRDRGNGTSKISEEGAGLIALAIDQIHSGDNPLSVIESAAFNLGLRPIGTTGELTTFQPKLHHDIAGGLKPGIEVKVVVPGWMLRDHIVERAKVKSKIS